MPFGFDSSPAFNEERIVIQATVRTSENVGKLMMVRKAGAAFSGAFKLRSATLKAILDSYTETGEELRRLQAMLVDDLYEAIPLAADQSERRQLLRIRRAIFNGKPVITTEDLNIAQPLRKDVFRYAALLEKRTALLESNRRTIFDELRSQLAAAVQEEEFRSILDYSCPWLISTYHRDGPGDYKDFSGGERGVYSYATKLFSKANPFYLFASVALPSTPVTVTDCQCEVILDTSLILALEKTLLPFVSDTNKRLVYIRSSYLMDNSFRFLVSKGGQLTLFTIKDNPLLRHTIAYFKDQKRQHTVGGCVDYVHEGLPSTDRAEIEKYIAGLIRVGIIQEYLVKDFDNFSDDLLGQGSEHDEIIRSLQRLHLSCISKSELPGIHKQISDIRFDHEVDLERLPEDLYYVNFYEQNSTLDHDRLAQRIYHDLQAIKPFFRVSNFYNKSYLIHAFLLNYIKGHPQGRVPYVEALCAFLRGLNNVVERYRPSVYADEDEREKNSAWLRRLAGLTGHLSADELSLLLSEAPAHRGGPASLCFNGSFDYMEGYYYLGNVLAGNGRFITRYSLHQGTRRYKTLQDDKEWLDVQLMPLLARNRSYVARVFPIGCGFEARFHHLFERWVDPSSILLEVRDGRVVYRDSDTGRLIRFHFLGFLLAPFLPPEYQLLLVDHEDFYPNPFEQTTFEMETTEAGETKYIPPLYYGLVCLRRGQWVFARPALEAIFLQDDILTSTVRLRDFIHKCTQTGAEDWYFRVVNSGRGNTKPRYLDLTNPLSIHIFRRAINRMPPDALVSLTRMEPKQEHMYLKEQGGFLTEVMIEV